MAGVPITSVNVKETDGSPSVAVCRILIFPNGTLTDNGNGSVTYTAASVTVPTGANPTATIGTAAVNGSAVTFMRSDAAPAFGNLTGPITSTGLATAVAAQTGTGSTFVMQASPTLTTPNLGTPSAGVLTNCAGLPVAGGGTGLATLTSHAVYVGNGTSAPTALSVGATNTVLRGSTGADPAFGSLVAADLPNTAVSAGSYTLASITVDAQGRLTAASTGTGAATSVSNSDGTLTISPTTGAVVASLALGHANTWTGVQTLTPAQAANTSVDGAVLADATAATSGNQQYSPRLRLTGQGWKTTATAGSQSVDWIVENQPVQGTTSPSTILSFQNQINAGGYGRPIAFCANGSDTAVYIPTATSNPWTSGLWFGSPATSGSSVTGLNFNGTYLVSYKSGSAVWAHTNAAMNFAPTINVGWGSSGAGTAQDIGLARVGTGILEVNTGTAGTLAALRVGSPATTTIGLVVKNIASQTANSLEVQNSSGTAYVSVGPAATGSVVLTLKGTASRTQSLFQLQTSAGASLGNVGGCVFDHFADGASTSTDGTENTLYTDTTVANTLAINGDKIKVRYTVSLVGSATATRRVRLYFAGIVIFDSGTLTIGVTAGEVVYDVTITRVTATTCQATVEQRAYGSATLLGFDAATYTPPAMLTGLTLSGTNIIKITGVAAGTGALAGDIAATMGTIDVIPEGN